MPPRGSVSLETLQLIWRAVTVFGDRFKARSPGSDGCLDDAGSEAYHVATSCIGAICDAREEEFGAIVDVLESCNALGHFCLTGSCSRGPSGSCLKAGGAFRNFVDAIKAQRADPALNAALAKHAQRQKYELVTYIALWEPHTEYGQVVDVAGEYVLSSSTGCRIREFDLGDEPTHSAFASRALDARDINTTDSNTKRLAIALQGRSYPAEKLCMSALRKPPKNKADEEEEEAAEVAEPEQPSGEDSGRDFSDDEPASPAATQKRAGEPKENQQGKKAKICCLVDIPTFTQRERVQQLCTLLTKSAATWDTGLGNKHITVREPGHFEFNSDAAWIRPHKDAFYALPLHLSRRYDSFIYDPVHRYAGAGGFAALCAAIEAAHNGRVVDQLYFLPDQRIGGWGARLANPAVGGDYNAFVGPLSLEKQVEYRLPLITTSPAGPALVATDLETRACAQPILEYASLLLKPQILLSVVPEHGRVCVDNRAVVVSGFEGTLYDEPVTEVRNYEYCLDSSPRTSYLLREVLRTIGAGVDRALRYALDAHVAAKAEPAAKAKPAAQTTAEPAAKAKPAAQTTAEPAAKTKPAAQTTLAELAIEYAVAPKWAATSLFDGAAISHWVTPAGDAQDSPLADTTDATGLPILSDRQGVAFVLGRLARFLWRHSGDEMDSVAAKALVTALRAAIPAGSAEADVLYYAGLWVQAVPDRATVFRRRAACVILGIFFDAGPDGQWWPNAVRQGAAGQRLPSLRDFPPFHSVDDSTIGILEVAVVDSGSRGQILGLLEVPKPSTAGFSFVIRGHSHCSFTDGNRFVAAAAASALAGTECRLVTGSDAIDWNILEPAAYTRDDGTESTPVVEIVSNKLYYDPSWANTKAEKVPFVGLLTFMAPNADGEPRTCFYRVIRSDETLCRETTARAEYELGSNALDPPPWIRPQHGEGQAAACDHGYLQTTSADGGSGGNGGPPSASRLAPGDHPPIVSGLDFSHLFATSDYERRGMTALQAGDRVHLALHSVPAWPKGITGHQTPVEATHAVLRAAGHGEADDGGAIFWPPAGLTVPAELQAVAEPTAPRPTVQHMTTPQHGDVVTPVFDIPRKGGPVWVDGFVALLFFLARMLQTGLQSKTMLGIEGLQGCGKTLLLKYLEMVVLGPNCARYVKNLAAMITRDFFQEHPNTLALFTDELDQSVLNTNEFKSLLDDKTGMLQLKHVNGLLRFLSHFTLFAAWNPDGTSATAELKRAAIDGSKDVGRRVVVDVAGATLVSHGKGRKAGGFAAGAYQRGFVANQSNPWINAGFHNFLMTRIVAGPGFNLQQFGGDSAEEKARLRCILLDADVSLWDGFIKWLAGLPEAQMPRERSAVKLVGDDNGKPDSEPYFSKAKHASFLAVVAHGLLRKDDGTPLNYSCWAGKDGLNTSIFNGLESHGWQDGLVLPGDFLRQMIDKWYDARHTHVKGKGQNTVAAGVLKALIERKVLNPNTEGNFKLERGAIGDALAAVGVAPPPKAHGWFERERHIGNAHALTRLWYNRQGFRGVGLRAFPALFHLGAAKADVV